VALASSGPPRRRAPADPGVALKVHLWGELGFYGPDRRSRFEVRLDATVPLAEVIRLIGVPEADVAVVGLNGEVVRLGEPSLTVSDRDRLDLFPATSGG